MRARAFVQRRFAQVCTIAQPRVNQREPREMNPIAIRRYRHSTYMTTTPRGRFHPLSSIEPLFVSLQIQSQFPRAHLPSAFVNDRTSARSSSITLNPFHNTMEKKGKIKILMIQILLYVHPNHITYPNAASQRKFNASDFRRSCRLLVGVYWTTPIDQRRLVA